MAILALKNHLAYKTIFDIHVQEKKFRHMKNIQQII
jgi:hypothetical protein